MRQHKMITKVTNTDLKMIFEQTEVESGTNKTIQ